MMHQIMLCRQLHIGGIVAAGAGAGFVSVPALFRTGRSFCCVLLQIMIQCGQHLTGGIVAAPASNESKADFRTGGGFCHVLLQIMVLQCRQLHIIGIVAAGTGSVSIPALFLTGGGFCLVVHKIMLCGQFFAGGIVAAGAGFVSIPADFRTGGGFCIVMHQIMIIWVSFAVFPTTHLTDRFGAAGCCATGTVCSINFGAVLAAAGVRVRGAVVDRRPRAPVVTENAVFLAAFFTDFACGAGGGLAAAGMEHYIRNIAIVVAVRAFSYINPMTGRIIFFVSEDLTFIHSLTAGAENRDCFCRRF